MLTTVRHTQFHYTSYFLSKAHTTRAVNTAAHFLHGDQRSDVFVKHNPFFFVIAGSTGAVTNSQILQLALAPLVANRAIQRMIDQQEFHHALLGLDGFVVFGVNDHSLRHRCGASRHGLRRFLNIDKTHAAIGSDRQLLVVAKVRDVGPCFVSRMHDCATFRHAHFLSVEFYFNHIFISAFRLARPQIHWPEASFDQSWLRTHDGNA